jgi:antitoxin HicB
MKKIEYPFTIRRLSKAEGGGWMVEFPDLPGCIADGETIEEAVENGSDALRSWLATAKEFKDPVPAPSAGLSGKWVQRVPKSLHAKLAAKAGKEGVSLNTLVVSLIAEGLGRRATE